MKKMIKAATDDSWNEIKAMLEEDFEDGVDDPLYEMTEAGESVTFVCQDVESELGVWLEPSIQGGTGGIWILSNEDDSDLSGEIDYEEFNRHTLNLALDSNSEEDFKSKYKSYLDSLISSASGGYDDEGSNFEQIRQELIEEVDYLWDDALKAEALELAHAASGFQNGPGYHASYQLDADNRLIEKYGLVENPDAPGFYYDPNNRV